MNNEDQLPEEFEGTEEEKLRLENEILKLKLQAEKGQKIFAIPLIPNAPPQSL